MSRIEFSGSLQTDIDKFAEHDTALVTILQRIATNNIGELNKNWSDEVSTKYLSEFNTSLIEVKTELDKCHNEMNRYFEQVQAILNGQQLNLPAMGSIEVASYVQSGDGIVFDIDQVNKILASLNTEIKNACELIEGFDPKPNALNGSSEDIYEAVYSNFRAAASLYRLVEDPLHLIEAKIEEVKTIYERKAQTITNATANS